MKIKEMHFNLEVNKGYGTGLYFVMEDGRVYKHFSTDPILNFERVEKLPSELPEELKTAFFGHISKHANCKCSEHPNDHCPNNLK